MTYQRSFRRSAKEELDQCCGTYGATICEELHQWISQLADEAEMRSSGISVDAFELLEEGLADEGPTQHSYAWTRLREASALERLKALLFLIRKRRPPWEYRASVRPFTLLGCCTCEVQVFYEVDHLNRRIIIAQFLDLPGQA